MESKHSKDNKKLNIFLLILRIILIIIIVYCSIYILLWYIENKKNSKVLDELTSSSITDTITIQIATDDDEEGETAEISAFEINFDNLLLENDSTVGWLTVPNTSINYPVVQYSDNSFYLNHSFDKTQNSAGWIFADYRNRFDGTDKNIIIYGHNRKDSSMFATLRYTQNSEWYNNSDNKYITFSTPTATYVYEVFSVYTIKAENYYLTTSFNNNQSYLDFLSTLKSRSIHDFGVSLNSDDSIITLSTCDATGKSRVIVHAKKLM